METQQLNIMQVIYVSKVTLNVGTGKDEDLLKRGLKLLEKLSSHKPVKTVTKKRIPSWGLRPGLTVGCKVTTRKNEAELLLKCLLAAKKNRLMEGNFDDQGNFSFGVPEYIDIQGMTYDPELKIMGLEVAVTLERRGFRVKRRKVKSASVGKKQRITKVEAMNFMRQKMGVEV